MCDYSLQSVRSRPAKLGDELVSRGFCTGTRGFCAIGDADTAVCLLPGTELSFAAPVRSYSGGLFPWRRKVSGYMTAVFRKVNQGKVSAHHDALEFPDGSVVLLTLLCEDQRASILQLPAQPQTTKPNQQQPAAYVD